MGQGDEMAQDRPDVEKGKQSTMEVIPDSEQEATDAFFQEAAAPVSHHQGARKLTSRSAIYESDSDLSSCSSS
jgi:hypothetical protein